VLRHGSRGRKAGEPRRNPWGGPGNPGNPGVPTPKNFLGKIFLGRELARAYGKSLARNFSIYTQTTQTTQTKINRIRVFAGPGRVNEIRIPRTTQTTPLRSDLLSQRAGG
jgi:hypothetical protein